MGLNVAHLRAVPDGNDCVRCGLCCTSPYPDCPTFVELEAADVRRLPPGFVHRNVKPEFDRHAIKAKDYKQPLLGRSVRVCAAFRGALGKKCDCRIYEYRPDVCRDWQPRNSTCMRIRRKFADAVEKGRPEEALE